MTQRQRDLLSSSPLPPPLSLFPPSVSHPFCLLSSFISLLSSHYSPSPPPSSLVLFFSSLLIYSNFSLSLSLLHTSHLILFGFLFELVTAQDIAPNYANQTSQTRDKPITATFVTVASIRPTLDHRPQRPTWPPHPPTSALTHPSSHASPPRRLPCSL